MVMRPAMMYALQMAALAKIQEDKMKVGELKRIRFLSGVTRPGRILNKVNFKEEYISGRIHIKYFGDKAAEARLANKLDKL